MATGREGFAKVSGTSVVQAIPDFPKLPEAFRRLVGEEGRKEIDAYEAAVMEFFKKQAQRNL